MKITGRASRWRLSHLKIMWLHGPRSGIVMVTAALSLVALLGVAALTIDLGRLAVATQRAQDVADAGALGAAYHLHEKGTAETRLADLVLANNAASTWPKVTVDPSTDITYYGPDIDVPNYGKLQSNQHAITVTAHVNDQYTFARIAGLTDMHTQRSATAVVSEVSGGARAAIFAMYEGKESVKFNGGSGVTINGDLHSNGSVNVNGSGYKVLGQLRYRGELNKNPDNQVLGIETLITNPEPYPVDEPWINGFAAVAAHYERTAYGKSQSYNGDGLRIDPGSDIIKGKFNVNGSNSTIVPGVYFVDGDVSFNGSGYMLDGVTFIASGTINFNGSGGHNSSVIGYKVNINGSNYTVSDSSGGSSSTHRTVSLVY